MDDDLVEVYRASGLPEAHALRLRLEAEGLSSSVTNELLQGVAGELPLGWSTAPGVAVRRADEAAARAVVAAALAERTPGEDRCLACGADMPGASTCGACGWSYGDAGTPDPPPVDLPALAAPVPPAPAPPRPWSGPWAELAAVLAIGVVPNTAVAVVYSLHPSPDLPFRLAAVEGLVVTACAVVAALYLMRGTPEGWTGFGVDRLRSIDLATGVVLAVAAWQTARLAWWLPQDWVTPATAPRGPAGPADLALGAARNLVSAYSEELVTRTYLITRVTTLFGSRGEAVLAAAVLFAAYHCYQGPQGTAGSFAFGLVYGAAFLLLRRVWPLAIGHALYNSLIDLMTA